MATLYTDNKKKEQEKSGAQQRTALGTTGTAPAKNQADLHKSETAEQKPAAVQPVVDAKYQYDASGDAAYQQALAALQNAQKEVPKYAGTYDAQIDDIYNQIVNREKFAYDVNSDMLYQQYKDQYVNLGELARKDSMGQAAALTGGYGSTYAQVVGQQQYDAYLQKLNDVVPELYGMALDQYNAEGDALYQQYAMLGDRADDEYGKYMDSLNQYWQNVDYLQGQADNAYNRGYENWYNAYQMQQDSYDKLVELITSTGYKPTADELSAAGMSSSQSEAYLDYYNKNNAGTGGSGGSGGSGGNKPLGNNPSSNPTPSADGYNNGGLTYDQVKQLQNALGVTADGKYGPATKNAAGGLSAKKAYDKYVLNKQAEYGFTGSTKEAAVDYLEARGVTDASDIMSSAEWHRYQHAYKTTGQGGVEVTKYKSYSDYLFAAVSYYLNRN